MPDLAAHHPRRAALRSFADALGYPSSNRQEDFVVWTDDGPVTADVVGFGRVQPKDMTTATVVGMVATDDDRLPIAVARNLASPVLVVALPNSLDLWRIGVDEGETELFESVPYDQLEPIAGRLSSELGPSILLAAKEATRQLALFPVDVRLLGSARRGSGRRLSLLVEQAIADSLGKKAKPTPNAVQQVSRLAIAALGALMFRDKFMSQPEVGAAECLAAARQTFPAYFGETERLNKTELSRLEQLMDVLGQGVSYAGLDPAVVSDVYEQAMVDPATRSRLGIFYTPPDLAHRLVANIPMEEVPPDARVVVDPACGSGTLLVAAHDRLSAIAPPELDYFDRHRYLAERLHGMDSDSFAVEIARFCLFLNALPAGDAWSVEHRSMTEQHWIDNGRPSFVVSNPPWLFTPKRVQLADKFVLRMLDEIAQGGFLAVILPAAWLSARSSKTVRREVQRRSSVYEVWRLPNDTFEGSHLETCVLLAQAGGQSRPFAFRRVLRRGGWKERFLQSHEGADEQVLAWHDYSLNPESLLRGPLDADAAQLERLPKLGDVAEVHRGPVPTPPADQRGGSGDHLWLRAAGDLPAFGEAPEAELVRVRFPDEFNWMEAFDEQIFSDPKLLVSAVRWEANPWRLKVGADFRGVIPSNGLLLVLPRETTPSISALLAILGSSVASCWVDFQQPSRTIGTDVLKRLPIPLDSPNWADVEAIGEAILRASDLDEDLIPLTKRLETVVQDAYDLSPEVRKGLARHFAEFPAPEGGERYAEQVEDASGGDQPDNGSVRRQFGTVLAVDPERGLRLWVSHVTPEDGQWIDLPERFPGWLCEPGATFEVVGADANNGGLKHARYMFHQASYMDLEELADAQSKQ